MDVLICFSEECNQRFTIFVSEENFIAIQDQKYEDISETRHVEEMNNVSTETYKEHEVLKSGVLDEVVDVSLGNCHVFSLHGSFEDWFDGMQGNLQLGRISHGQPTTEFFEGCHVFYDPVAKYMEGLGEGNDWSYLCLKHQFVYHSLLPLSISFFSIEHHTRTRILG